MKSTKTDATKTGWSCSTRQGVLRWNCVVFTGIVCLLLILAITLPQTECSVNSDCFGGYICQANQMCSCTADNFTTFVFPIRPVRCDPTNGSVLINGWFVGSVAACFVALVIHNVIEVFFHWRNRTKPEENELKLHPHRSKKKWYEKRRFLERWNMNIFGTLTMLSALMMLVYLPAECSVNSDCASPFLCDTSTAMCMCTADDFDFVPPFRPTRCDVTGTLQDWNVWVFIGIANVCILSTIHCLISIRFDCCPRCKKKNGENDKKAS
jgi:hypothetical protein